MADHRAEQIVQAVITKVTGLTTTGSRVYRSRTADLADANLPALVVFMGPDQPRSDGGSSSFRYLDGDLTVAIEAVVKETSDTAAEQKLNLIRKEVAIALQADVTQGLSFVLNTTEGTATPDLERSDKVRGSMRMDFVFHYRRSRTDPSA
ncbi:MAG: hypothetical protein VW405_20050 [Rhodospirillaceae bacterium]|jgi:hypothetical protein